MQINHQDIHDLTEAKREIEMLRRVNEVLQAKVSVFDSMMLIFVSQPNIPPSFPMGVNPAYKLGKIVEAYNSQPKPENG